MLVMKLELSAGRVTDVGLAVRASGLPSIQTTTACRTVKFRKERATTFRLRDQRPISYHFSKLLCLLISYRQHGISSGCSQWRRQFCLQGKMRNVLMAKRGFTNTMIRIRRSPWQCAMPTSLQLEVCYSYSNFYPYQSLTRCSCCRCDQNGIVLLSPRRNI